MTIKTIVIAAACLTAGILSAANVKVGNNDITINNAKVTWGQNGIINITKNGQKCLDLSFQKFYMKGKEIDWRSCDSKNNTAKKKGNAFTWELKKTFDGKTYTAGTQTLEVLADGKLKYSLTFNTIKAPGWVARSKGADVFINVPYALFDNTSFKFNGKEYKFAHNMKWVGSDSAAQYIYVFNSAKVGTITLSAAKADSRSTGIYPDKWAKAYRATYTTNAKGTLTVIIDLGK